MPLSRRRGLAALLLSLSLAGTLHAQAGLPVTKEQQPAHAHHHAAAMPAVVIPAGALYTEADVRFMQGMIAHHAQAIHMSRMAAARDASPRLVRLAQKIDLSQAGEIALMQDWLRAHRQFAPDTSSWRTMTMAGMLTAGDLARLQQPLECVLRRERLRMRLQYTDKLIKARRALRKIVEQPENVVLLQRCVSDLHQVQGVLRLLEIFGAALLAEEMERGALVVDSRHERAQLPEEADPPTIGKSDPSQIPVYEAAFSSDVRDLISLEPVVPFTLTGQGSELQKIWYDAW